MCPLVRRRVRPTNIYMYFITNLTHYLSGCPNRCPFTFTSSRSILPCIQRETHTSKEWTLSLLLRCRNCLREIHNLRFPSWSLKEEGVEIRDTGTQKSSDPYSRLGVPSFVTRLVCAWVNDIQGTLYGRDITYRNRMIGRWFGFLGQGTRQ